MRDITLEETVYFNFTTRSFTTGVPTTLAGSPVLSVLESNNATPITSGVSVSVDRASVTGLNQATVVATAANGYEAGKSYAVYISTGTVGGVSVVGEVVAQFTVQSGAAFTRLGAPAGASTAADIAAVKTDTAAVKTKTDFLPSATAGSAGGVFIAGTNAATTITTGLTTTFTGNLTGSVGSVTGAVGSVTGAVGSVTGNVGGNVTGSVGSVVGAVGSVTGAVGSVTGAVGSVTGNVGGNVTGTVAGVTPATAAQVAAVLTTQITESYRANDAAPTLAQFMSEVLAHLGESAIVGTTKTIKKFDHASTAATFTLDSSTTPASVTRST